VSAESADADDALATMFEDPGAFHSWAESWRAHFDPGVPPEARARAMRRANPDFIPSRARYDDQPAAAHLAVPPLPTGRVTRTFYGT